MKTLNLILAAVCVCAVSASDASVLDGYEKIAEYNAREAAQAKSAWQVKNYSAGKITVKDGKVLIDNGKSGRDCYGLVSLCFPDFYQLDGARIALKAKLRIVNANGSDNTFTLSIACGDGIGAIKDSTIMLAPGKVILGGVGPTRSALIKQGKTLECILLFDPKKSETTVLIDGQQVIRSVKSLPAKNESVWFGDGASSVSGVVEIESIELYRSEK